MTPPTAVKFCLSGLLKLTSEKDKSEPKNKVLNEELRNISSFPSPSEFPQLLQANHLMFVSISP